MAPRDGLKFLGFGRASAEFTKLRDFSPAPIGARYVSKNQRSKRALSYD